MTNDDPEPPSPLPPAALAPKQPYKENDSNINPPQLSNPPETPTPPPGATLNATRAPEHMTLPEKHQAALRHIHTLESHNTRLYEDNCRLVNAVNTLNDRLTFLGAPQNTQVLRLADMQERLRISEANRASINRKYQELLQCISAGSAQHHINEELQATRGAYASLDREYRLLGDKYTRLKAIVDASRVAQQHSQTATRGLIPVVRPEITNTTQFRPHDQGWNTYTSPLSALSPSSFQPFLDQKGNNRRPSSESVMVQPSLRSCPTPISTTWLAPLPTPPPSAPLPRGQISPTGFPVHAQVPAGSLPLPHHPQIPHDPRTLSRTHAVTQPHHLIPQDTSEQPNGAVPLRQSCAESTGSTSNEPVPFSKEAPVAPAPLTSSPHPPKRPNSELPSMSPGGEHKKPRIEGEAGHPTTGNVDTCPANKMSPPPTSADIHDDRKSSVPDSNVRSYQDCVNLIFEKDANVENGVFCGLCLDRHEAKMIPEPPDVLVQPDFDSLVRHCMTMHPAVWDDLRRKA